MPAAIEILQKTLCFNKSTAIGFLDLLGVIDCVATGLVNTSMKVTVLKTKKTIPPAKIIVRGKPIFCIVYIITSGIIAPPALAPVRESPNAHQKSFKNHGESVALIAAAPTAGYAKPIIP